MKQISFLFRKIDPFSLRLRLTIGTAVVSTLGLSILTSWTSWKMQQILIESHKQNIEQIAERLPRDLQIYSEMMPPVTGLQKAINNLTTTNTLLWLKSYDNKVTVKSTTLNRIPDSTMAELMTLTQMPIEPQVHKVSDRYFILRGGSLQLKGQIRLKLFVVQDVTHEQKMLLATVKSLAIVSALAIIAIAVVSAFYIQHSLQPLRRLSQMAEVISAEDLPEAQLHFERTPSEVKELAQTFNKMLSRLSQSWQQEREFVSNVSHELRTPLTIVHGYLQSVLRRQNNLTETQREALEIAASETEHTIRLLQDLLDLARADGGHLHFRMESCVLNDLVEEVVVMAQQYSDRTITIEAETDQLTARADYNRMKQVLLNLIDNAIKYSEASTPIILKLSQLQEEAVIQVCDQGDGIPLQHQSRIFERFYRVDEARSRTTGGSGLGLSIVKTLVEGMGGSVSVRSKLEEGSIFTICLPTLS